MTVSTECEALVERYKQKQAQGLIDVKFFVRNAEEALKEEICEEVNRLDDAIEEGNCVPLVFNDRHA